MTPADLPPPRHLPTPVRRALSDDDLTPEKVQRVLRQTRLEMPVPLDAEGTPPDGTRVIDPEEMRKLFDSDEVSLEAAKASLAQARQASAANIEESSKLDRATQSGVFRRPPPPRV